MRKSGFVIVTLAIFLACVALIFSMCFPVKHKKIVEEISQKYNLDFCLVLAVINVESGWDNNALSSSGAVGVMQVMPATADEFAVKVGLQNFDLTNFSDNLNIGCCYLRYLLDMFGDQKLALCAYNAGLSNVRDWLNDPDYATDGVLTNIPFKETRDYVKKVNFNKKVYDILF